MLNSPENVTGNSMKRLSKSQIKAEALKTAGGLCTSVDMMMFDEDGDKNISHTDQCEILRELWRIGRTLTSRAERIAKQSKRRNRK